MVIQDRIVMDMIGNHQPCKARRRALYTSGTYGSGKTRAMRDTLASTFDTGNLVRIDPDEIRRKLPEWSEMVKSNPETAGEMTHMESTFIALLAEQVCLELGLSYLIDGSLGDAEWYAEWLRHVASLGYIVDLVRFECPLDLALERCETRARETGRHIPRDNIERAHARSRTAWPKLTPLSNANWVYETSRVDRDGIDRDSPAHLVSFKVNNS
jgi:predicted ABC-type ATPase